MSSESFSRKVIFLNLFVLLPAILAFFLMRFVSPHGFIVSPDSVYYLMGAEGFRRGLGFVSFEAGGETGIISHWPSMYSLFLTVLSPAVIGYLALLLSALIVQFMVLHATEQWDISLLAGLLVITSPVVLKFSTFVLSDMLFVAILLSILLILYIYGYRRDDRLLLLLILLSVLLVLTRYAGLFISAVLFVYLWRSRCRLWKNLLVSSSPIIAYGAWKFYLFSHHTHETRHIIFHPPSTLHLSTFFQTLVKFVSYSPEVISGFIVFLLFLVVVLLLLFAKRRSLSERARNLLFLSALTIAIYLLFLLVSITFFDFYTLPDERILLPLYPLSIILIASFVYAYPEMVSWSIMGALLILNLLNLPHLREERLSPFSGYNAPGYASLKVLQYVSRLPADAIIYSNAPDLIWYHTRKPVSMVPRFILPVERRKNPDFDMEIREMVRKLTRGNGYIVWLSPVRRGYLPPLNALAKMVPVEKVIRFPDGVIIVVKHEG